MSEPRLGAGLLGPVRAVFGAIEIPLGPGRQRAVFALLASSGGRSLTRREIVAALWDDSPPASAAGSVYTYVSGLRRAFAEAGAGADVIVSTNDGYALLLDPELLDVTEFERLFAAAEVLIGEGDHRRAAELLKQALSLFRGEPYDGVQGPHADRERVKWTERKLIAVEALAEARLELGEHVELVAELRPLVSRHPLRESLYALLMRALTGAGLQAEAFTTFRNAVETLRSEFGVTPGAVLRDAYSAVLHGENVPGVPEEVGAASISVLRQASSTVHVGREAEVGLLRARLDELVSGIGGVVWIEGDAGIGKSELLAVALSDAERLGCHVGWAAADQLSGRFPLQVLLECLGVDPSSCTESARRQFADGATCPGTGDDPMISAVDRLLAHVDQLTARSPVVLVLDDLHWADDATVFVWRRLVGAARQLPLLLVTGARSQHRRPELDRVRSRVLSGGGDVLRLAPLAPQDVDRLTAEWTGGRPGDHLRSLTSTAEGNPLHLRELVGALIRDDAVEIVDGVAHVAGAEVDMTPRSLLATVRRTALTLTPRTREVLFWVSVLGAEATIERIARLSGRTESDVAGSAEEAASVNVLVIDSSRLLFGHPLLREAVYDSISEPMRQLLHRGAAKALAGEGAPPTRVAEHLVTSTADLEPWVDHWLIDNVAELAGLTPLVALELLERAMNVGDPRHLYREVLLTALVRVLFNLSRDAEAQARQALLVCRDAERTVELRQLLAATLFKQGEREQAIRTLTEVEVDQSVSPVWKLRHKLLLAHVRRDRSNIDETERSGRLAYAEAVRNGDPALISHALQTGWLVASVRRNHEAALRCVDEAIDVVRDAPDLVTVHGVLLDKKMFTLQNLDRLSEADDAMRAMNELALAHGVPASSPLAAAVHHYWSGRWNEAVLELEALADDGPAITYAGLVEPGPAALLLHGVAALIALRRGDDRCATTHLNAAQRYRIGSVAERENCDFLLAARSLAAVRAGDTGRALAAVTHILDPGYSELMLRHQWLPEIVGLAVRAGDTRQVGRALEVAEREAAAEVVPARAHTALLRCRAQVEGDPEPALAAVEHYREVGRRAELASALGEAAALLAASGRSESARSAFREELAVLKDLDARWDLRRATERMAGFGIHPDLSLVGSAASGDRALLTSDEGRIAALVASGQSNPDIALQLSLPRRTIQAHVTRIMDKFGVCSRAQIADHREEFAWAAADQ